MKFNLSDVEASYTFGASEAIPAGDYEVIISNVQVKENKSKTGKLIQVDYTVSSGSHTGYTLRSYFNVEHEKAQVQVIGKKQFSGLVRSAAAQEKSEAKKAKYLDVPDCFPLLIGKSVIVTVIQKEGTPYFDNETGQQKEGRTQNEVKGVKPAPVKTAVKVASKVEEPEVEVSDEEGEGWG